MSAASSPHPPSPFRPSSGITLIEVLISMFVLLFGLMGVAAIFPVASHYVLEGDKRDRSSGLAQVAFEELKARNVLKPQQWLYGENNVTSTTGKEQFIVASDKPFIAPMNGQFNISGPDGYGRVFVIDPLGVSAGKFADNLDTTRDYQLDLFPERGDLVGNPWEIYLAEQRFPLRRMTINADENPVFFRPLEGRPAETLFRLRDDLAVDFPEAGDRPSMQRWGTADINPATGNDNNTPKDSSDDTMLARQYVGDYSWLATVVPTSNRALAGLQPAAHIKDAFYEVTAVVFYKRDIVPSIGEGNTPGSERFMPAEFINSSELAIYSQLPDDTDARDEVDRALTGIKPTTWIAVMGVNRTTGTFMLRWYKILAMDDETGTKPQDKIVASGNAHNKVGRYLMVQGADWPSSSRENLSVAILPGAIDAYTRVMQVDVE